jgi:hypothetical protein
MNMKMTMTMTMIETTVLVINEMRDSVNKGVAVNNECV